MGNIKAKPEKIENISRMGNVFTRKAPSRPRFKSMVGNWFSSPQTRKLRQEQRSLKHVMKDITDTNIAKKYLTMRLNNVTNTLEKTTQGKGFQTMKFLGLARGGKRRTHKLRH